MLDGRSHTDGHGPAAAIGLVIVIVLVLERATVIAELIKIDPKS